MASGSLSIKVRDFGYGKNYELNRVRNESTDLRRLNRVRNEHAKLLSLRAGLGLSFQST